MTGMLAAPFRPSIPPPERAAGKGPTLLGGKQYGRRPCEDLEQSLLGTASRADRAGDRRAEESCSGAADDGWQSCWWKRSRASNRECCQRCRGRDAVTDE